jgi:hypothetical protein
MILAADDTGPQVRKGSIMTQTGTQAVETAPTYFPLPVIARQIRSMRGDKPLHPATLSRWILTGVRLRSGETLRLNARRLPGGWQVSREAVEQFIERLTADRCGAPAPAPAERPVARRRDVERAEAELDRIGI